MFVGYFVIGLCALRHFGVQGTIIVILEDITFEEDPKYLKSGCTNITIEGDDEISAAFTMAKTIPARARGHFVLLGMSMGEYIVPTGLDVEMPLCEMVVEPILMGPIFTEMGFPRGICPVPVGTYKMEKFKLPLKNLPDEFEENKYLGKFEMTVDGKPIMCIKVMTEVMNE